ncbi:hypothetical protein EVA_12452 [gut metagenome]|uniref:Uncharacterized protein n=1 Tax=gut metagenome TaxID=749906 RepID=J9GIR9_9ZZZZ
MFAASISFKVLFVCAIWSATIWISVACPWAPPEG